MDSKAIVIADKKIPLLKAARRFVAWGVRIIIPARNDWLRALWLIDTLATRVDELEASERANDVASTGDNMAGMAAEVTVRMMQIHGGNRRHGQPNTMIGQVAGELSGLSASGDSASTSQSPDRHERRPTRGYKRDNEAVRKAFHWLRRNMGMIDLPSRVLAVRIKVGKDSVLKARKFIKDGYTDVDAALADDVK